MSKKLWSLILSASMLTAICVPAQAQAATTQSDPLAARDAFVDVVRSLSDNDAYGGIYVDDDGLLHIQAVDADQVTDYLAPRARTKATTVNYVVDKAEYSLKDMLAAKEILSKRMNELRISALEPNEIENRLNIFTIGELSAAEKQAIHDLVHFEGIAFFADGEVVPDAGVRVGEQILRDDGFPYSLGACITWRDNGQSYRGFATAGHGLSIGDVIEYNGDTLGTVKTIDFESSGYFDLALIQTSGNFDLSNTYIKGDTCSRWRAPIAGEPVTLYGATSRTRTGKITGTQADVNYTSSHGIILHNMCSATYGSDQGDSGGAIVMDYNGTKYQVGIHSGHNNDTKKRSYFTNFSRMNDKYDVELDWD